MRYVLVSSNGTKIDHQIYETRQEAVSAMRTSVRDTFETESDDILDEQINEEFEFSWISDDGCFLCALDNANRLCDDWIYKIVEV